MSAGSKLRKAIEEEVPLQVVGTINAYCARLAERAGFKALYLSGAGAANASFGLPDLGITTLNDVCEDVRRITATTQVPLLVDADTGWGSAFNIARTVREFIRAGAAGWFPFAALISIRCPPRVPAQHTARNMARTRCSLGARLLPQNWALSTSSQFKSIRKVIVFVAKNASQASAFPASNNQSVAVSTSQSFSLPIVHNHRGRQVCPDDGGLWPRRRSPPVRRS